MAKYYYKCSICKKTCKRKPNFKGNVICNNCKKDKNTILCQNCGKPFFKRKSVRKFCSAKCSGEYLGEHVLKGKIVSKITREKLSKIGHKKKQWLYKN